MFSQSPTLSVSTSEAQILTPRSLFIVLLSTYQHKFFITNSDKTSGKHKNLCSTPAFYLIDLIGFLGFEQLRIVSPLSCSDSDSGRRVSMHIWSMWERAKMLVEKKAFSKWITAMSHSAACGQINMDYNGTSHVFFFFFFKRNVCTGALGPIRVQWKQASVNVLHFAGQANCTAITEYSGAPTSRCHYSKCSLPPAYYCSSSKLLWKLS